jgi:glucose/arabinose dehydrogenase
VKARSLLIGCAILLSITLPGNAQQSQPLSIQQVEGYLVTPQQLEFDESLLQQLKIPAGFRISVFAKDLGNPRMLAIGPDGTVYVTRREQGDILALSDRNGDGAC